MNAIRCVLIDIEGVLCIGTTPVAGAVQALQALRRSGVGLRFVTNTTRKTREQIVFQLQSMGFEVALDEVVTGAVATRQRLLADGRRPYLLVHPGLRPEFEGLSTGEPNAVVLGDAGEGFSYAALNAAFRVLVEQPDAPLLALAANRYFRAADGLWLDAGPYMAALEYACGRRAEVMGKPSPALFAAALRSLGAQPQEALMIGDDVDSDVGGAQAAGLRGVLVRTGKYRPDDPALARVRPDAVVDDFAHAVQNEVLPRLAGL